MSDHTGDVQQRLKKHRSKRLKIEEEFPEYIFNVSSGAHGISVSFQNIKPKEVRALLRAARKANIKDES